MQAHRIKHASRIFVHSDERACRGIHISRTEIIQPSKAVVLLAAVEIAVLSITSAGCQISERVERVGIGNRTALVR